MGHVLFEGKMPSVPGVVNGPDISFASGLISGPEMPSVRGVVKGSAMSFGPGKPFGRGVPIASWMRWFVARMGRNLSWRMM